MRTPRFWLAIVLFPLPSAAASAAAPMPPDSKTDYRVPPVVVTAPRVAVPLRENPAATTIVERALEFMPRTIAVDEALELVPGVKVDNQADGERVHVSFRGTGILTERGIRGIQVLLDDLPLNDPSGFAPDLFDVDWATVQRIEVFRGPASALYGGGSAGGILNVMTRDGTSAPIGGRVTFGAGSYDFWKGLGEVEGTTGTCNYRASGSRTMGDGYRDHTAFFATNVYSKLNFRLGDSGRLTAIVSGTDFWNENAEGLNLDWLRQDRRQANPDALKFNEYQQTQRGTFGVVGKVPLAHDQEAAFRLYFRHTQWTESVPSTVQHRTLVTPGGFLQYTVPMSWGAIRNHFSLGADFDGQRIDDFRRPNLGGAHEGPEIVTDQTIHQRGFGAYLLDRVELGDDWGIMLGLRRDDIRNTLDDNLLAGGIDLSGEASFERTTGRVGVSWNRTSKLGAYASWGQGFLPPATEELANNPEHLGGFNSRLVPATSQGEEIGARGTVANVSYDFALFRVLTDDDFGRFRVPGRPLETFYGNVGSSRRYGLETLLKWFPVQPVTVQLAYTYSHFRYDKVTYSGQDYEDTWLPNSPQHQTYVDAEYRFATHLSLGLSGEIQSRGYVDPTNRNWAAGYGLLHARVGCHWSVPRAEFELTVSGRNLTGKEYIAFTEPDPDGNSYQPAPTREVFGGLQVRFF